MLAAASRDSLAELVTGTPLLHDAPPDGLSTSHMRALLRSASGRHTATAAITDPERAARGMATLSTMFEPASLKRERPPRSAAASAGRQEIFPGQRCRVRAAPPLRKGLVHPQ